jgi:hypothetical protein
VEQTFCAQFLTVRVHAQIIDKAKEGNCDEDTLALTGAVTTRLRHPCIVRVLAHCVTDGGAGVKPWDSALSQQGARYDNACWMLLEYCDRGTLLVGSSPVMPLQQAQHHSDAVFVPS